MPATDWSETLKGAVGPAIGAAIALLGVGLQRFFDSREKETERRHKLLTEAYLGAWEGFHFGLLAALRLGLDIDPKNADGPSDLMAKSGNYMARVFMVGSVETVRAFEAVDKVLRGMAMAMGTCAVRRKWRAVFREGMQDRLANLEVQEKDGKPSGDLAATREAIAKLVLDDLDDVKEQMEKFLKGTEGYGEALASAIRAARKDLGLGMVDEGELSRIAMDSTRQVREGLRPALNTLDIPRRLFEAARSAEKPPEERPDGR